MSSLRATRKELEKLSTVNRRWEDILKSMENLPEHQERFAFNCKPIPKNLCKKTNLGWSRGADEQYRCEKNVHIRWFKDGNWCLVHRDFADPRKDPIGHLICDVLDDPLNSCRPRTNIENLVSARSYTKY